MSFQLNQALPKLNVPSKFSTPFPNPAGVSHTLMLVLTRYCVEEQDGKRETDTMRFANLGKLNLPEVIQFCLSCLKSGRNWLENNHLVTFI
jgi:hypothetical protein